MKVLMASSSYPETGLHWQGRFIANLAAGLGRRSDTDMTLWAPPGDLPSGVTSIATAGEEQWLRRMSQRGGIAHLLRNHKVRAAAAAAGLLIRLGKAYRRREVDVVHVNWLQNAIPLWGTRTPAVVSVLGSDFGLLRVPAMKSLLRSVFRQRRTILAPNADWMAAELHDAFGDIAEIHPIPFGVDERWFALQRRAPRDGRSHWLTVTRLTRKKVGDLFEWGEGLFGEDRTLHLFGPMQEDIALPAWISYHGPTHPAELIETWFPQASGLITLSRHDEGRPQVMLEAMASGLPVIASDLPAHKDFIAHRSTGWLVASRDDLISALTELEEPIRNRMIGDAARIWANKEMGTWDDCAARYASLYARLLEGSH